MSEPKAILTVVESLQGQKLNLNEDEIYNPDFWKPFLPIKLSKFQKMNENTFNFEINDQIQLDPTGTLNTKYSASGTFQFDFLEVSEERGGRWAFQIHVNDPLADVSGIIRARNLAESLKIGIFIYSLKFDESSLIGYGTNAIMFAIRLYLRKMLQNIRG
jgi:hypothetical protein